MKRVCLAASLCLVAGSAFADNYATCLLDKLPGTENDIGAYAVMQICLAKYPVGLPEVAQGSGRGFFGFSSGAECTAKKTANTRSHQAALYISVACRKLYDEPILRWE